MFNVYQHTYDLDTDTDPNYFRLPDLTDRVLWGCDSLTDPYIAPGIPNITGTVSAGHYSTGHIKFSGAFYKISQKAKGDDGSYDEKTNVVFGFDANKGATKWNGASAGIYGGSTTVQPPAIKVIWVTRFR